MVSTGEKIWGRRTFCLITGASQGIGRVIASQFACKVAGNSHFLLTARNSANLEETSSIIKANAPSVNVTLFPLDLEKVTELELEALFQSVFKDSDINASNFEVALIVHNAASVGNIIQKSSEIENCVEMTSYFHFNLISTICLNTKFLKRFKTDSVLKVVINITSLAAKVPFNRWSFYCTGKAARNMFFKVLAIDEPHLRVLSYSPGPVQTDMTLYVENKCGDEAIRQYMKDMRESEKFVDVNVTVAKLIQLLEINKFQNGQSLDFYDEIKNCDNIVP